MTKVKCSHCETRVPKEDAIKVSRKVGGNFRRAPSNRTCNLCLDCAGSLLARVTPGHSTVSGWDIVGLKHSMTAERERRHADLANRTEGSNE